MEAPTGGLGEAETLLKPLASPRLNACQEFGTLAAKLHTSKCVGGLDIKNCTFEPDGTLISMFSLGRGPHTRGRGRISRR